MDKWFLFCCLYTDDSVAIIYTQMIQLYCSCIDDSVAIVYAQMTDAINALMILLLLFMHSWFCCHHLCTDDSVAIVFMHRWLAIYALMIQLLLLCTDDSVAIVYAQIILLLLSVIRELEDVVNYKCWLHIRWLGFKPWEFDFFNLLSGLGSTMIIFRDFNNLKSHTEISEFIYS